MVKLEGRNLNAKLYFSIYGSGMGHAARTAALAKSLGSISLFSSWGEGKEYLEKEGFNVIESPSVDVEWSEQGRMAIKKSITKLPRNLSSFAHQIICELSSISKFKPDVVISDSRLSPIIASHILDIPSILITNQLRIALPLENSFVQSFLERITAEKLGIFWSLAKEIIAPDLPPPYTISEKTLLYVSLIKRRIRFIGFLISAPKVRREDIEKTKSVLEIDSPKVVYAQVSGPKPTKRWMVDLLILASKELPKDVTLIVSMGEPRSTKDVIKSGNLRLLYWNDLLDATLSIADLVVTRGGHSSIAKCISMGKPMVLLPIAYHGEQIYNSKKAEKLGIARMVNPVSADHRTLAECIIESLSNNNLKEKALEISEISSKFNAFSSFKEILRTLIS